MGKSFWQLIPKLHPDHEAQAADVAKEKAELEQELKAIPILARLLWPPTWDRRLKLNNRVKKLEAWQKAALAPIGHELDPPRIGVDEKATEWYRKHLSQDPDAWPLPPDEMIEELRGEPVWELVDHPLLSQLDIGWPKAVMHVPAGPGFSLELLSRLDRNLSPEGAVEAAGAMEQAATAYLAEKYPSFGPTAAAALAGDPKRRREFEAALAAETPLDAERRQADVSAYQETLVAVGWLRLWGELGYGFTRGVQSG